MEEHMWNIKRSTEVTPKQLKPVKLELIVIHWGRTGWSNIIFYFHFSVTLLQSTVTEWKTPLFFKKSQIQKPVYSHQMAYNLYFYIQTWDNDIYNVCVVVNKVSLFELKTADLGCFHLYGLFFFPCVPEKFTLLKKIIQVHAEIESCYSYIIFHWIVATYKEIKLNFPCRHRASFSTLLKSWLVVLYDMSMN